MPSTTAKKKTGRKKKINKVFVLDTSVLLYSSSCIFSFKDNEVVIPLSVLDELDRFKSRDDDVGRNARQVARHLYKLGKEGSVQAGVKLNDYGGKLRISTYDSEPLPTEFVKDSTDHRILGLCLKLIDDNSTSSEVVLITKDINLLVKADALGIASEDYIDDVSVNNADELYTGMATLDVEDSLINTLHTQGAVQFMKNLYPNQFVLLRSDSNPKKTVLARFNADSLHKVSEKAVSMWGIKARNLQQIFATNLLVDDSIPLVSMTGKAGSGKTILAVAAGLQKVLEERRYKCLVITRPIVSVGKGELGFLPGSIHEKYEPWMRPIRDAVEILFSTNSSSAAEDTFNDLVERGIIKVEPLSYVRGRSFHNSFIILDEAQNLTRHEIKTFLTRVGENTKIVVTGDIMQIDSPVLDVVCNGLTQLVDRFKEEEISGHISLVRGERSTLAEKAADLL